jgi:hypothetical protein
VKQLQALADLTPDPNNANKGSARGDGLLEHSLQQLGAARSIVVDRNGLIVAGNKTHGKFGEVTSGRGGIVVIQTTGHELVVVQRTDLDLLSPGEDGRRARELAIADNRIGELDLDWDPEALLNGDVRLDMYFGADELKKIERDAEALWVSQGTAVEREPKASPAIDAKASAGPPELSAAAALEAVAPKGEKPRTIHECPKCGHAW